MPQLRAIDGLFLANRRFDEALDAGITAVVTGRGAGCPREMICSASPRGGVGVVAQIHFNNQLLLIFLDLTDY